MTPTQIDCAGAPRDLGFDQGRQCRALLQRAYGEEGRWRRAALRIGRGDARCGRALRDLVRHFPQQSECIEGLVRGADVPYRWLAERTLAAPALDAVAGSPAVGLEPPLAPSSLLARAVPADAVVRHSLPEGGFSSVEFTLPWLTAALAGVNAGGLAAVGVSFAGGGTEDACAAPAGLLVQDCLARFDSVAGARDWCLGRPAGGCAAVLLCDAGGALAAVAIERGERRSVRAEDGLLLEADDGVDVAARLRAAAPGEVSALAAALGERVAVMDPAARRIGLFVPGGRAEWWQPRSLVPDSG